MYMDVQVSREAGSRERPPGVMRRAPPRANQMLEHMIHGRCKAFGEVAEWSKAAVLKTVEARASVGSNPTFSAI